MTISQHIVFICFFFALGACIGSFLNVVVWRLPRGESLVTPPSHCPKCEHKLAWRDNIPVFGWIFLKGKCRYCGNPISPRYPIGEAIVGLLFVGYYIAFFMLQVGPCPQVPNGGLDVFDHPINRALILQSDWPIYLLDMFLVSCLFAASLIDAELYLIPPQIPAWGACVGIVVHAIVDEPTRPGALNASPPSAALAFGSALGLLLSWILLRRGILPLSFQEGGPELEIDKKRRMEGLRTEKNKDEVVDYEPGPLPPEYSPKQIRAEMRKEMLFLMPPLALGGLFVLLLIKVPALAHVWVPFIRNHDWASGFFGALLGGLVGGFTIWFTRIVFSVGFGKEAMGLGDVDLMFAVGAVLGPGASVVTFFLAPFCGMGIAIYRLILRKSHQIPFGPYLSMAAGLTMLFYCPIAAYFTPGMQFIGMRVREILGV